MPNAVIARLEDQRAEQVNFVDQLLGRVDAEGRDLVPAERDNLTAARQRIGEIDDQLSPLREFDALRTASANGTPLPAPAPRPTGQPGQPLDRTATPAYRSAGAYIVDTLRATGVKWANVAPDPNAQARLQRAVLENQLTTDTPGLLPEPVIGPVINTIDASRPFVTSLGVKSMGGIPGAVFSRPKITQHVDTGRQVGEKTQLPSRKMVITPVAFAKETYGGTVDISRQDIDWTSPAAWDALVADLAAVYGADTEIVISAAFATAITQVVAATSGSLEDVAVALYEAAAKCYAGGAVAGSIPMGRLPDRMWVSLDMWATVGALVDVNRMVGALSSGNLGTSELGSFSGDVLNLPRIVVPGLPTGSIILGSSALYEVYEEMIGLISAVEPSILGVEVAYGGYVAYGMLEEKAFCKVTIPAGP